LLFFFVRGRDMVDQVVLPPAFFSSRMSPLGETQVSDFLSFFLPPGCARWCRPVPLTPLLSLRLKKIVLTSFLFFFLFLFLVSFPFFDRSLFVTLSDPLSFFFFPQLHFVGCVEPLLSPFFFLPRLRSRVCSCTYSFFFS